MVGSHHALFEGNWTFNVDSDDTHGNAIYHTYFRNYAPGLRTRFTDYLNNTVVDDGNNLPDGNAPLRAAGPMRYSYWMSFVGSVLGTPGAARGWNYEGGRSAIFRIGWKDNSPYTNDPQVASTAIGTGNYDYVRKQITGHQAIPLIPCLTRFIWQGSLRSSTQAAATHAVGQPGRHAAGRHRTRRLWGHVRACQPRRATTLGRRSHNLKRSWVLCLVDRQTHDAAPGAEATLRGSDPAISESFCQGG
jgi:hypothetical protein